MWLAIAAWREWLAFRRLRATLGSWLAARRCRLSRRLAVIDEKSYERVTSGLRERIHSMAETSLR